MLTPCYLPTIQASALFFIPLTDWRKVFCTRERMGGLLERLEIRMFVYYYEALYTLYFQFLHKHLCFVAMYIARSYLIDLLV